MSFVHLVSLFRTVMVYLLVVFLSKLLQQNSDVCDRRAVMPEQRCADKRILQLSRVKGLRCRR